MTETPEQRLERLQAVEQAVFPHLTDAERSADALTLRWALEEARRDADTFAFTISDIIKALDDAGFQQRELPPLERVKEVIKMLELIKGEAQEQSEAVQRDWLSPCEVEGLRRKVADECACIVEYTDVSICWGAAKSAEDFRRDAAAAIRERFGVK